MLISKALKKLEDGTVQINVDPPPRQQPRSRYTQPLQQYIFYDADKELEPEEFNKHINKVCYCMLCVMGTVLTVGFVIITTMIILNRK